MRLYITLLDRPDGEHVDSRPIDFCRDCYPEYEEDDAIIEEYEPAWAKDKATLSVDHHTGHPDYNDDPEMYKCESCDKQLGEPEDDD